MDIRIISAVISAGVALLIAVLNHFVITPIKEKKASKREKLKKLYAPLYSLVIARINISKAQSVIQKKIMLGTAKPSVWLNSDFMNNLFLEQSGYASDQLIEEWVKYSGSMKSLTTEAGARPFVVQLVKDYNKLKKDLKLAYSKDELETGIPDILKGVELLD
ncbi:hypothetical protein EKG37_01435 [Robertmurraya yapensis]|uniref:Uncharacterized protein n=2 Tax=Bacillaceae TaxID=186817 RepID=A0A431WLC2_9BACI|nr:hypothetical protein [Bacillus yapensis]RTR36247.1 hypothetical protein EKG37_01435 [Bacillus yapensis]TKT05750.1 hypothetical protein FAR12_01435 [Bacillus yapensis]